MKFKNILNLYEVEMQSKNKRISHYNINFSIINSDDLGSKKLFFDVKELKPGQLSYPYHYHSDHEELFIIIDGEVTLRQNDNKQILKKGDLVFFPNTEEGAHQLLNHTDQIVKYLDLSTLFGTDICKYPDSNKLNAGSGEIYKMNDRVDYFEGEESIPHYWNEFQRGKIK